MYFRFVVAERDESSQQPQGIFQALYRLRRAGELAAHEEAWFAETEDWFGRHLKRPRRLTETRRPNAPDRAISWLKASAIEHVSRMRGLAALLEHKGVNVQELRTTRPGYIVYEDEHQVATLPFADTP
jgi:hypothetical protein